MFPQPRLGLVLAIQLYPSTQDLWPLYRMTQHKGYSLHILNGALNLSEPSSPLPRRKKQSNATEEGGLDLSGESSSGHLSDETGDCALTASNVRRVKRKSTDAHSSFVSTTGPRRQFPVSPVLAVAGRHKRPQRQGGMRIYCLVLAATENGPFATLGLRIRKRMLQRRWHLSFASKKAPTRSHRTGASGSWLGKPVLHMLMYSSGQSCLSPTVSQGRFKLGVERRSPERPSISLRRRTSVGGLALLRMLHALTLLIAKEHCTIQEVPSRGQATLALKLEWSPAVRLEVSQTTLLSLRISSQYA